MDENVISLSALPELRTGVCQTSLNVYSGDKICGFAHLCVPALVQITFFVRARMCE